MTDIERMLAEHACARLCQSFHAYVDTYRHEEIVPLFVPDAVWIHRTGDLIGHDGIRRYLDGKSTAPIVRHVVTNVLIDVESADRARGRCYVTVYFAMPDETVNQVEGPVIIVQYDDEFRRTPEGWRFSRREPKPVFKSPAFANMIHSKADEAAWRERQGG